ncbi:hypothetical protein BD410DRAFT_784825 [Rickenella mellea]|uniref:Ndufb8, NADH dehydrogenase 19kDa subunit n=1 Tax=Rickenella mellea TaxID=50990 RepID=A0A4Y7QG11_9AGAM|nr:hypothetical protein BD410DRAFT_784825 [Rickenella mellea]
MNAALVARRLAAANSLPRIAQQSRNYATPIPFQPQQTPSNEKDPQLGDYPDLPYVSKQLRPPSGWWDPQMRRNFGELPHEKEEILSMFAPDVPPLPPRTALFQFTLAVLGFVGIGYLSKSLVPERPAVPREYPFSGLVKELGGLEENKALPETENVADE